MQSSEGNRRGKVYTVWKKEDARRERNSERKMKVARKRERGRKGKQRRK